MRAPTVPCNVYAALDRAPGNTQLVRLDIPQERSELLGPALPDNHLVGLAVSERDGNLYALGGKHDATPGSLYRVDPQSGAIERTWDTNLKDPIGLVALAEGLGTWEKNEGLVLLEPEEGTTQRLTDALGGVIGISPGETPDTAYVFRNDEVYQYVTGEGLVRVGPASAHMGPVTMNGNGLGFGLTRAENLGASGPGGRQAWSLKVFDLDTTDVRMEWPPIPVPEGAKGGPHARLSALTWPRACGSTGVASQVPLIQDVQVSSTSVCAGDTVTVSVKAEHFLDSARHVGVRIHGQPATEVSVQLNAGAEADLIIPVTAFTEDRLYDRRRVRVHVRPCEGAPPTPLIAAKLSIHDLDLVDLTVLNARDFPTGTHYTWSFGDGTSDDTSYPHVAHDFVQHLNIDETYGVFDVSVTAHPPGGEPATGEKSVTVYNDYALGRAAGTVQLPVSGEREVAPDDDLDPSEVELTVRNPEAANVRLTRKTLTAHHCDGALEPIAIGASSFDAVIAPGATLQVRVTIPDDRFTAGLGFCHYTVDFSGEVEGLGLSALATHPIVVREAAAHFQPVTDPAVVTMLNEAAGAGLVDNPLEIREAELAELAMEGRLPSYSLTPVAVLQDGPEVGDRCRPGEDIPRGMACRPTDDEWEWTPPFLANARKGDSILSPGCGLIGKLLAGTNPPEVYSHMGMMTANYHELANSTASAERIEKSAPGAQAFGVDEPTLKFGFPGQIVQSVFEGYVSELMPDPETGEFWEVSAMGKGLTGCVEGHMLGLGETTLVPPRVVRPPAEEEDSDVRARLHQVADAFRDMKGHYRFFAYTDAEAALRDTSSSDQPEWAEDTPGLVCSSAVWAAMFRSDNFVMEGDMGEGRPGEDITDTDGLYFYDEEERINAAFEYEAAVLEKVVARGEFLPFLFGSKEYYAAQMLNCFAFDRCERPDAFQSELDDWETPGTGTAVSPNSILFWDGPQDGGPYGLAERLIYIDTLYRRVHRLEAAEGTGHVVVSVTLEGEPLDGVYVDVAGTGAISDSNGRALVGPVPEGLTELRAYGWIGSEASPVREVGAPTVAVVAGESVHVNLEVGVPTGGIRAHVVGNLHIFDHDVLRSEEGDLQVSESFPLTGVVGAVSGRKEKCIDDEVKAVVEWEFEQLQSGTDPAVRTRLAARGFEWWKCTEQADEQFLDAERTKRLELDADDDLTDAERLRLEVNAVNGNSKDRIDGTMEAFIEREFNDVPPRTSYRRVVVSGQMELTAGNLAETTPFNLSVDVNPISSASGRETITSSVALVLDGSREVEVEAEVRAIVLPDGQRVDVNVVFTAWDAQGPVQSLQSDMRDVSVGAVDPGETRASSLNLVPPDLFVYDVESSADLEPLSEEVKVTYSVRNDLTPICTELPCE